MDINIGYLKHGSPWHEHKFYEIIIYTQGFGIFKSKNLQIPFSPGTIIIVPPENAHTTSVSSSDFASIFISGSLDLIPHLSEVLVLSGPVENDGHSLAKMIYQNRYKNSEYSSSLITAFQNYILQNIEIDDKMSIAITAIINEITENFFDCNLNISTVLNSSGYAEDYIRAQFKKATGKTPVKFLTEIRISHACLLIDMYKHSLSLSEIAEKCGYTDYVYFSRRFKEIMGVSPRRYAENR